MDNIVAIFAIFSHVLKVEGISCPLRRLGNSVLQSELCSTDQTDVLEVAIFEYIILIV